MDTKPSGRPLVVSQQLVVHLWMACVYLALFLLGHLVALMISVPPLLVPVTYFTTILLAHGIHMLGHRRVFQRYPWETASCFVG